MRSNLSRDFPGEQDDDDCAALSSRNRNPESITPSRLCSGNGQQQKPLLAGWIRASDAAGDILSSIVAGDNVEHAKPAPDMVFKALKEMKGTADETLVVGDMNFDVDMAHHAGCKACAVTYGNETRQQLASAEWIIDDFAELLEIVKNKLNSE